MPHVQNAKQAEELVRLCRFPPFGDRSFPPAALIGDQQNQTPEGKSTYDVWNEHAAVICQIEDLEGLENVEEICRVPGGASKDVYSVRWFGSPAHALTLHLHLILFCCSGRSIRWNRRSSNVSEIISRVTRRR